MCTHPPPMGLQLQCPIRIQGPLCTCVWHFQRGKLCWAVSPLVRAGARPGPLLLLPPQAQAALYPHPSPYPPPPCPHHSNCWGEGKQGLWPLSPCLSKAASPSSHLQELLQDSAEEEGGDGGGGAGEGVGSGMQEADAPPAKRQRGTEQKSPLGVDRSESLARGRNRENKMKAWLGWGVGGG